MNSQELRNLQEAYLEVYQELDEATAMAKRGLNEPEIRKKIASNTGGGQAADRATALADKQTYGQRGVDPKARENLARKQRGDFRSTTSSSPGLHGYAHKSNDPAVKDKQAARGAQRGVLTPNEKKKFNRGGSSTQGVGSPSGATGRFQVGGGQGHGISGIKLADEYSHDLYDIILSHLLDEGYAETPEAAEVIMVNMSEEWRGNIVEATVLAAKGGVAGAVQVKQTKTPGFLGTGIGSKTVSTPIPSTFTRNTPGRQASGPRSFDAYGSGSKGAEAEMSDRSGPTDAERNRYNTAVTKNNTVGDKSVAPSPRAVNQRANQKGHSGLMPTRDNQNSTIYTKPNQSWRGY